MSWARTLSTNCVTIKICNLCFYVKREQVNIKTWLTLELSFDTKQNEQQIMQINKESNPALKNMV